MPIYNYACYSCDNSFSESHSIAERNIPTQTPCANCGGEMYIKIGAPGFISDSKSTLTRAGSEWNDVVSRIKKGSGKDNSIHD